MKKILLLSTMSLAMLMADITLIAEQLTKASAPVTETPPPVTNDPVNTSGFIPNSVDQIWADMNEPNTGWVSNMPSGFGQFKGAVRWRLKNLPASADHMNTWIEVEAAGDGSGCSTDVNKATNTRVEIGTIRMYTLRNNTWSLFHETKNTKINKTGSPHPHEKVAMSRGCGLDEFDDKNNFMRHIDKIRGPYGTRTNANGFLEYRPDYYYRWHAWERGGIMTPFSTLQAVFSTVYVRLVVDDPSKPDDRHLANYVAHLSGDARANRGTEYIGDLGMSRYKKITNDWAAVNFYTYYHSTSVTEAEIAANPPPIVLEL